MTLERSSADALPPITPPVGVLVIVEQISRGESEHIEGFFTVITASVSFKSRAQFHVGKKILRSALRWAVSYRRCSIRSSGSIASRRSNRSECLSCVTVVLVERDRVLRINPRRRDGLSYFLSSSRSRLPLMDSSPIWRKFSRHKPITPSPLENDFRSSWAILCVRR
jgi:hypothetical protein